MKKKITSMAILLMALALMTGCANVIPEMSEEQQALVVEYAVGVLLQNDKKHEFKLQPELLELMALEEAAAEQQLQAEQESEAQEQGSEDQKQGEDAQNIQTAEGSQDDTVIIDNTEDSVPENVTIEWFLNMMDEFTFTYTGYDVVSSYPEKDETQDVFFAMNATAGNELLVLKFSVQNVTEEEKLLNIAGTGVRFKIVIDGEEKNALTTMLLDDMAYYQETLGAGESRNLVVVCEIPEGKAGAVQEMSLIMKSVDNTATIPLF